MHSPLLNISFGGTNNEATCSDWATVQATKQFSNRLLLSGVGSPDGFDKEENEHYPTPGSFDVDEQLKRQPRNPSFLMNSLFFQRIPGLLWAAGDLDNLTLAMKHVERKMEETRPDESVHINVSGFSRGGTSAIHLSNLLYKKYANRLRVNLFLIDPNAGADKQYFQHKRCISPNVDNFYVVFNQNEFWLPIQSLTLPHFQFTNSQTSITALYAKGGHPDQEQLPALSAQANMHLLSLFYQSYGSIRNEPTDVIEESPEQTNVIQTQIQKGFVKCLNPTALDRRIDEINTLDAPLPTPFLNETNANLVKFSTEIQQINHSAYDELNYYFMHLLSEVERMDTSNESSKKRVQMLKEATNKLMIAMTPSNHFTRDEKKQSLHQFNQVFKENNFTGLILEIAACITGLVTGMLLGIAYGAVGFFAGLTRWETLGLAAVPYTAIGLYQGCNAGFLWGRRMVLGHENDRHVNDISEHIVNFEVDM